MGNEMRNRYVRCGAVGLVVGVAVLMVTWVVARQLACLPVIAFLYVMPSQAENFLLLIFLTVLGWPVIGILGGLLYCALRATRPSSG